MKKLIKLSAWATVIVVALFFACSSANAQVGTPVECPVGYTCVPVTPPSTTNCYQFNTNLQLGSRGVDVVALQTALISKGFDIPDVSSGSVAKGYFGLSTFQALMKWQTANGIPATGFFGPLSRVKMNQCVPTNPVTGQQIVASLDTSTPQTSTVLVSDTTPTNNIVLAVFDLKSQNGTSTLQGLKLGLNVYSNQPVSPFINYSIWINGMSFAASEIGKDYLVFKNINVVLPSDVNVPIKVLTNIGPITGDFGILNTSINLPLSGVQAVDGSYNPIPVGQGPIVGLISGATITFTSNQVAVSNTSTSKGTMNCTTTGICMQQATFAFTLTAGNDPIFISTKYSDTGRLDKDASIFFNAKGYLVPASGSLLAKDASPADSPTYFYIAPGTSRSFGFTGMLTNADCPAGYTCSSISEIVGINYGTNSTDLTSNTISSGLENLMVVVDFGGGIPPAPTSISVLTPKAGEVVPYGRKYTISWGANIQSASDIFDINEYNNGGKGTIASVPAPNACVGVGKQVCSYGWTPNYISSTYQIGISQRGTSNVGYSGNFSVSSSTIVIEKPSINRITPNSGPFDTRATIYGFNFALSGNTVKMACLSEGTGAGILGVNSPDKRTIQIVIPSIPVQSGSTLPNPLYCNITVSNSQGESNAVPFTVTSGVPPVTPPTINVISPNGGEAYTFNDSSIPVSWLVNYSPSSVQVHLYSPTRGDVYVSPVMNSTLNQQFAAIPTGATFPEGQYKVNVCDETRSSPVTSGKPLCDLSDNYFTISQGSNNGNREAIRQLYLSLQCREPDAQGWDYWSSYQAPLDQIKQSMMSSTEYQTKQQITQVFQQVLGRAPGCDKTYMNGESELNYWYAKYFNHNTYVLDINGLRIALGGGPVTPPVPTTVCPAGYICTPVGQTMTCPQGYICAPVTVDCPSGFTCTNMIPEPIPVTPVKPSITFGLGSDKVVLGSAMTLTWSVANATSCTLNGPAKNDLFGGYYGPVTTNGQIKITLVGKDASDSLPATLTLSCTGPGGSTSANATVPAPAIGMTQSVYNTASVNDAVRQAVIDYWSSIGL